LWALSLVSPPQVKADVVTNGNFGTGDLTGWTPFTTANGTNGSGLPAVVSFNTTGSGASNSAEFNVGAVSVDGTEHGGGISQTIHVTIAGLYDFSAAIASQDDAFGQVNAAAGLFSILIDGATEGSDDLGAFSSPNQVLRGTLSGSVFLTPGPYTFSVEIERRFLSGGTFIPTQYVTNISLTPTSAAVPEAASVVWLLTAVSLAGLVFWKRRLRV
jgi:hypothetical protein